MNDGWNANLAAAGKAMITRALQQSNGNKSKAEEILAIHRRLLYEKMREFGIADTPKL